MCLLTSASTFPSYLFYESKIPEDLETRIELPENIYIDSSRFDFIEKIHRKTFVYIFNQRILEIVQMGLFHINVCTVPLCSKI